MILYSVSQKRIETQGVKYVFLHILDFFHNIGIIGIIPVLENIGGRHATQNNSGRVPVSIADYRPGYNYVLSVAT